MPINLDEMNRDLREFDATANRYRLLLAEHLRDCEECDPPTYCEKARVCMTMADIYADTDPDFGSWNDDEDNEEGWPSGDY